MLDCAPLLILSFNACSLSAVPTLLLLLNILLSVKCPQFLKDTLRESGQFELSVSCLKPFGYNAFANIHD